MLEKAAALRPMTLIICGLNACALLARLANTTALAFSALNTPRSALSALIAAASAASFWNDAALFAKRGSLPAAAANCEKDALLLANWLKAAALANTAAMTSG